MIITRIPQQLLVQPDFILPLIALVVAFAAAVGRKFPGAPPTINSRNSADGGVPESNRWHVTQAPGAALMLPGRIWSGFT